MAAQTLSDAEFVLLCLKVVDTKPDFNVVANEASCSAKQAYHRHWRLMRNAPPLGSGAWVLGFANSGATNTGLAVPATPAAPKKRARKIKIETDSKKEEADEDAALESTPKKAKIHRKSPTKNTGKESGAVTDVDGNDGNDKEVDEVITVSEDGEQD